MLVPEVISPDALVMVRILSGALFFSVMAMVYAKDQIKMVSRRDLFLLVACGIFGVATNQYFFYHGMKLTNPINGSIFNLINPITIIIASYFILDEKINFLTVVGFVFSATGALLLLDFHNFSVSGSTFWGDLMIMINAISFGIYVVIVAPLARKYNAFLISSGSFITGLIIYLPIGMDDLLETDFSKFQNSHWAAFWYIILFTTLFVYFLNNFIPKLTSPRIIGFYVYFQPFVASIVAIVLGKDELTLRKIWCGLFIIAGIYLAQMSRTKDLEQKAIKGKLQ